MRSSGSVLVLSLVLCAFLTVVWPGLGPLGVHDTSSCAFSAPAGGPPGHMGPAAPAGAPPAPGAADEPATPATERTTNTIVIAAVVMAVIAIIAALATRKKPQ